MSLRLWKRRSLKPKKLNKRLNQSIYNTKFLRIVKSKKAQMTNGKTLKTLPPNRKKYL